MERKIKLIWDFRGPDSLSIARHHEIHLRDFLKQDKLREWESTGTQEITKVHSVAYWIVPEGEIMRLRDLLKPHRATVYSD